uniref:Uncharacterized protein n=1 Tax=Siphoviridae sp. ct9mC1 TaxID=2827794 RepID=A0A8S5SFU4_9CAUD|nr:MAG TPA: hypothetical protein [Siphoviridae sp. ct9mC1]
MLAQAIEINFRILLFVSSQYIIASSGTKFNRKR